MLVMLFGLVNDDKTDARVESIAAVRAWVALSFGNNNTSRGHRCSRVQHLLMLHLVLPTYCYFATTYGRISARISPCHQVLHQQANQVETDHVFGTASTSKWDTNSPYFDPLMRVQSFVNQATEVNHLILSSTVYLYIDAHRAWASSAAPTMRYEAFLPCPPRVHPAPRLPDPSPAYWKAVGIDPSFLLQAFSSSSTKSLNDQRDLSRSKMFDGILGS